MISRCGVELWEPGYDTPVFRVFHGHDKLELESWLYSGVVPETRLIAIGEHPSVLVFPCSVQSYDDITGVWGNVSLVRKMDYFVDFMDYAKTDYVYVQAGHVGEENRSYTLIKDLIEWGKLVPVFYENGNLLAAVEVNGDYSENSARALTEFEQCYIKKEANEKQ